MNYFVDMYETTHVIRPLRTPRTFGFSLFGGFKKKYHNPGTKHHCNRPPPVAAKNGQGFGGLTELIEQYAPEGVTK